MSFVHLHVLTEYSFLEATCTNETLLSKAYKLGMSAIAITDHVSLAGVPSFLKQARQYPSVKPIIGCEILVDSDGRARHLLLLAKNLDGYRNLVRIVSEAHIGNADTREEPCIGRAVLQRFRDGLICCSACFNGEISARLLDGDADAAEEALRWYKAVFGDDFYLEVVRHRTKKDECHDALFRLADKHSVKIVATNDVHFVDKKDVAMQTGQEYLKSESEMRRLFPDHPEVIDNTLDVAGKIETYDIRQNEIELPEFVLPKKELKKDGYLRQLAFKGAKKIYGKRLPEDVKKRLEHELKVISREGFTDLFLIVWDYVKWARQNGIFVGPGRGRSPGSLILYCLGVTDVDPIRHGLLFERFINPETPSFPDIDVDIDASDWHRVFEYLSQKYGEDHVGFVTAYGSIPPQDILRKRAVHACRIVLGQKPLCEYLPLNTCTYKVNGRHYPVSQFSATDCDGTGVVPLDIIGLKDLTHMDYCLRLVKERYGEEIDIRAIPQDDPETFALYARGDMDGIFHCDDPDVKTMLRIMRPDRLEDLMIVEALRQEIGLNSFPKAVSVKRGRAIPGTGIPEADDILAETYGLTLYQEQVMIMTQIVAGFSPESSDFLRRALARNDLWKLEDNHRVFILGGLLKGADPDALEALWSSWISAKQRLFNKSHAACYALLSYRTAWLKAHYPEEFEETAECV